MAPTAPHSKAIVIQPVGIRTRVRSRNRCEDDIPKSYNELGIQMAEVNNWMKNRRPISLDADGRVPLKQK